MTGLVRKAAFLAMGGLLIAGVAMAGVPTIANSTIGNHINLGVTSGGSPGVAAGEAAPVGVDSTGRNVAKKITVRDGQNNPVPNVVVRIDFAGCSPPGSATPSGDLMDIRMCQTPQQQHPGGACEYVEATTGGDGIARFRVIGRAQYVGSNGPGWRTTDTPCAVVTLPAFALNLGSLRVGAFDLNGAAGVTAADVSLCLADRNLVAGRSTARSDYNGVGGITAADVSLMLEVRNVLGNGSSGATSCTTSCP